MLRTGLRFFFWIALILVIFALIATWWFVYRPLPQVDGSISVPGLHGNVTVERDNWGSPHITATSVEDLAESQGYVAAQDRLWQMDFVRRSSRGQLAEILGSEALSYDKGMRILSFSRAAERDYATMNPSERLILEAYARGVNQFIEQHSSNLPIEFTLLNYKPSPWHPTDTLVVLGYMFKDLTDKRESKIHRAIVTAKAGPDFAKDLFSQESPMDHFVVGESLPTPTPAKNIHSNAGEENLFKKHQHNNIIDMETRQSIGSNNWVIKGEHTATGLPLLANDPHLSLSMPSIWYGIHLTAPGWNAEGFTLPGVPFIVIGHNDRIAWGATNNGADVMDLYIESFNPNAPQEYLVNGQWKKAEVFDEVVHVKGGTDEHVKVLVTRHGPIIQRDGDKGYAMRWVALEPGALSSPWFNLGRAQNWEEFRDIVKNFYGPAQNLVYGDVDGNIGYIVPAKIPIRKNGNNEVPVPGDTDDYEWTGYIPFEELPQVFNPKDGFIVTANARVTGPGYAHYITDDWADPYRTARIFELLHNKNGLRAEDMLKVQADTYSYPHVFIASQLGAAALISPPHDPRAKSLTAEAKSWDGNADPNSYVVAFLDAVINNAQTLILEDKLGKDAKFYDWRKMTFLQRVLTQRPAKWLPSRFKNYDELLTLAADLAVKELENKTQDLNPSSWHWKVFNSLKILHPLGRSGILKSLLSFSEQPQGGTKWSPRAATKNHGPSFRFVADLANWDRSILLLTGGQSGQPGSQHYADQFSFWFEGKPIYQAFSKVSEAKVTMHTLTLEPGL